MLLRTLRNDTAFCMSTLTSSGDKAGDCCNFGSAILHLQKFREAVEPLSLVLTIRLRTKTIFTQIVASLVGLNILVLRPTLFLIPLSHLLCLTDCIGPLIAP